MFLKMWNKVREGANPATFSAPTWFAMPRSAGTEYHIQQQWGVQETGEQEQLRVGGHPFSYCSQEPILLLKCCLPTSRLSPLQSSEGHRLWPVPVLAWPRSLGIPCWGKAACRCAGWGTTGSCCMTASAKWQFAVSSSNCVSRASWVPYVVLLKI